MNKINLNKVYEFYIPYFSDSKDIGIMHDIAEHYYEVNDGWFKFLKSDVVPWIKKHKEKGHIKWCCFLYHPMPFHYAEHFGIYGVHFRIEIPNGGVKFLRKIAPKHAKHIRKISKKSLLSAIENVDIALIKDGNLEFAWQMLGETTNWIINLLDIYDNLNAPQAHQFKHYIDNSLCFIAFKPRWKLKWKLMQPFRRLYYNMK